MAVSSLPRGSILSAFPARVLSEALDLHSPNYLESKFSEVRGYRVRGCLLSARQNYRYPEEGIITKLLMQPSKSRAPQR